jgi:hypothetical protein
MTGALLMGVLLVGCGAPSDVEDVTAGAPVAEQSRAPTEASPEADSAGAVATAPPSCEDAEGDSTGALDLASVTVFQTSDGVVFGYTYTGLLPTSGTLLFVTSDGSKQYGYKSVDGQKSGHFVFNVADARQGNVEADAEVGASEARVSFPRAAVDVEKLAGGTATINVDGDDIDECRLE